MDPNVFDEQLSEMKTCQFLMKSYQTSKKNTAWNPQKENEVKNDCVNHYFYFCR